MNGDGAQRSGAQMIVTMIMTTISDEPRDDVIASVVT